MLRRSIRVALMVAMLGAVGWSQRAEAGVTYDIVFRSGGGGTANFNSYTFSSVTAAQSGAAVMDVFMSTADALIINSISVGFDDSKGLAVAAAGEWKGLFLAGPPGPFYGPIDVGVDILPGLVSSFDGTVVVPNGPPSLPPGTYNIGSIIWDTSGAAVGSHAISATIRRGFDGTAAVIPAGSGNIVDLTRTEILGSGFLNIVPEPATAGLIGFGLAGLALYGRRREA